MFHVHRAERADALADALATVLIDPLEDPFTPEILSVPTRGMERWLTQRLSTRLGASSGRSDGVCANVEFPFPRRLVNRTLAAVGGLDPDADPWPAERSVWLLLELVDRCLGEPWLGALATHLGGPEGSVHNRRFASVRQLAELYERYSIRRPEMLVAWARGEDTDGAGRSLPADGAWQAELWRRLRERIGRPSPAEQLDRLSNRLREEPGLVDLPPRLSLFGLTRLPASYLRILTALAGGRDVHLFVLHPSPALWRAIAERTGGDGRVEAARGRTADRGRLPDDGQAIVRRAEDVTATLPTNRVLASWGQDSRELQLVLGSGGEFEDHHHETRTRSDTLLARLQADIKADRAPPGQPLPAQRDERSELDPHDTSLQVHACHGRARQVEVIRDAILHLLADDPTLEPRDVIVMCPDIETVAPLIQAAFGAGRASAEREGERGGADRREAQDPRDDQDEDLEIRGRRLPDLRVRLADRSLRQTNPVLGVVSHLLELADQRVTASQLLDLADRDPVRRRFRFDDDDVTRMQEWVVASGIRWGLDAAHRQPYKLDVINDGTWRAGLDRILLGVAMTEEERKLVGGALPLDDVDSGAIELAGRMAEFVDRVRGAVDALAGPQPIQTWATAIGNAADALTATGERDSWQRAELGRILEDALAGATRQDGSASSTELELADVRALLADRLRGRPTRANFRTGHLTICTLVPMRSVPHRAICILGLDDGEFPRKAPRDGDDLTLHDPHVGDRDPRSEDRQMLLDALMAATERLIITYTGNDERTNVPRPPAVPVAELLDVIDRTFRCERGEARDQVLVRHPLQPFDPRNFVGGGLVPARHWSFDQVSLDGARAMTGPRRPGAPFLPHRLPPAGRAVSERDLIELEKLVRFAEYPVRAFLRDRLGVNVSEYSDDVEDALAVELDGLATWEVGQRLLEGLLAGAALEDCVEAELGRGSLPPGMLATPLLDRVRPLVQRIAQEAANHTTGASTSLDVNLRLPDGRALAGTVPGVYGDTIRRVSYSRVRPRQRLAAWVRLLALTVARPERRFEAVVIGRVRGGVRSRQLTIARIPPLGPDLRSRSAVATRELTTLVELYDRGMREPLPIASDASAAYADAVARGADPYRAAHALWETTFGYDKEDRQPEHLLVHGGAVTFAELIAERPRPDEQPEPWPQDEETRFGRYAVRLWEGLLAREQLTDR